MSQQEEIDTLQETKRKIPPERATIKINDIPTELLERILIKYVQQANNSYKNTQGKLIVPDLPVENEGTKKSQVPKKRTIAKVNEDFDYNSIYQDRLNYSNEMLPQYGFEPQEIKKQQTRTDEPMLSILNICVAQIMELSIKNNFKLNDENNNNNNVDLSINKDTLYLMSDFTTQFFSLFTKRLNRLKEIQRRRLPNRDDLNLLLREGYVDLQGLNEMYYMTQEYNKCNKKSKNNILNEINKKAHVATLAFNGHDNGMFNKISDNNDGVIEENSWWIDQIVHRKNRRSYIPDWMPPLPPDYTFKSTPKYSQRITSPIELREKIVQEGRFAEKALDHIIGKENTSIKLSKSEDESVSSGSENEYIEKDENYNKNVEIDKESSEKKNKTVDEETEQKDLTRNENSNVKSDNEIQEKSKVDIKNEETNVDKKNDLAEYAKIRMKILDKRRKEEEDRYLLRIESDESKFGRNFGFYTNLKKLPGDINNELNKYREKKFKDLISNLKKQEEINKKWAMEQEELRKKIDEEKSKYAEANEIHIGNLGNPTNGNANDEFFYDNVDEEVDFDVEFSDMEEVEELPTKIENKEAINSDESKENVEVNSIGEVTKSEDNAENIKTRKMNDISGEDRVLSVRFQDEVQTSFISNNIEEGEVKHEEKKSTDKKEEEAEKEDIEDFDEEDFEDVV